MTSEGTVVNAGRRLEKGAWVGVSCFFSLGLEVQGSRLNVSRSGCMIQRLAPESENTVVNFGCSLRVGDAGSWLSGAQGPGVEV